MLKLCGFPISNYFNKVRLALLEKGVPHELDITAFPSQEAQFRQRSPMGKIPFLQTEHGILCESQIICEYIEELHPETPLLPRDPFAKAKVRELTQVLELHVELVSRRLLAAAFFGGHVTDETKAEVKRDLDKGLRAFSQLVKFDPFLAGSEFTLADCAAANHFPLISMTTKRMFGSDALSELPQLADYLKLVSERPHVKTVYADRDAAFARVLNSRSGS
ncbi:MAG TPA: glutathione S-transferase [Pseudomonadota bacterium]|jgi:glutathione S-transferase|nr:glutathione S-transferase [Pseudomonadota bacterium]HND11136.1 glutathione S-transferase [Pseudomonadota bacterium]HNK43459.1 glutathione S-transferase [Pseudomonadota bacterium]HNN51965.1 glutathione S-transferase [Pseudomonadota bacterium]